MDSRGWTDIAYSWLVDNKGDIYEGRGWGVSGGHTKGQNSISHGICYIGNTEVKDATNAAKESINLLIEEHEHRYGKGFVRAHRDAPGAATACPGVGLFNWIKNGRPVRGATANLETAVKLDNANATFWVNVFYSAILHRPSDDAGKAFWVARAVSQGLTREDLFFGFIAQAAGEVSDLQAAVRILQADITVLRTAVAKLQAAALVPATVAPVDTDKFVDEVVAKLVARLAS